MNNLRFFIQNMQCALFIENFAFRNKLRVASRINEAVKNLFDGDPTMLDLPPEAPSQIPRIQLKDSKSNFSLNFSPIRIDFFYNEPGKPAVTLNSLKDNYLETFFAIVDLVKEEYRLSISRLAIVVKALAEVEKGSNSFIFETYLNNNPFFKDTYSLEIHSLKKMAVEKYTVNRWFRIKTARTQEKQDAGLLAEIDINTLPEEPKDFGLTDIKCFYNKSIEFIKDSFASCFGVSL